MNTLESLYYQKGMLDQRIKDLESAEEKQDETECEAIKAELMEITEHIEVLNIRLFNCVDEHNANKMADCIKAKSDTLDNLIGDLYKLAEGKIE